MMWLNLALQCAYTGDDLRCEIFLRRADYFADRLIAEQRHLDTDVAVAGHPRELADILRFRAYTQWLLGKPLNRKDLRQAASDYIEWCLTKAEDKERFSDSVTMALYLEGVREGVFLAPRRFATLDPTELRNVISLPPGNLANQITTVQIPAGTRLFIGRVAPQTFVPGQTLSGGGTQVFILDKTGLTFGPPRSFP